MVKELTCATLEAFVDMCGGKLVRSTWRNFTGCRKFTHALTHERSAWRLYLKEFQIRGRTFQVVFQTLLETTLSEHCHAYFIATKLMLYLWEMTFGDQCKFNIFVYCIVIMLSYHLFIVTPYISSSNY